MKLSKKRMILRRSNLMKLIKIAASKINNRKMNRMILMRVRKINIQKRE